MRLWWSHDDWRREVRRLAGAGRGSGPKGEGVDPASRHPPRAQHGAHRGPPHGHDLHAHGGVGREEAQQAAGPHGAVHGARCAAPPPAAVLSASGRDAPIAASFLGTAVLYGIRPRSFAGFRLSYPPPFFIFPSACHHPNAYVFDTLIS